MAAKEEKASGGGGDPKGGWQGTLLIVLKFLFAALFLPVVIGSTMALQNEVMGFDASLRHSLWIGLVAYLVLFFFVYDFAHVYQFGQNVMTFCFQFFKPMLNFAPYVLPIYTIVVLIAFAVMSAMGKAHEWQGMFFSLIAFTFSMHIILTAKDLYKKDPGFGKPTYFFGMELVYIIDVFLIALVMNVVLPGFSFIEFFKRLSGVSLDIYKPVIGQLFGVHW